MLIKEKLKLDKGSGEPNRTKVGTLTRQQIEEIAAIKMPDLNCYDIKVACKLVVGTAKSMGVEFPSNI